MSPELKNLFDQWNRLSLSDRYLIQKNLEILGGRNIKLDGVTGTKIGTSTTQKLGFWNATPVVQQTKAVAPSGGGNADNDAVDNTARAAINSIIATLTTLGLTN